MPSSLMPYALCLIADSPLRLCTSAQMAAAKMDLVVLSISDISAVAGYIGVCIDIYRYRCIYRYMYRYIGDGAALREAQALLFMYVRYVYRYIYIDIYTGI